MRVAAKKGLNVCPGETRPAEFPNGRPWSSASINTSGKFSQAEGRFEMRAKLPAGRGFWPAFWMTSQNYPYGSNGASGELDVFEVFGQAPTDMLTSAWWSYASSSNCVNGTRWKCSMINEHNPVADTSDGYHTYVMEWEDNAIRWYFDGVKVFEIGDNGTYKWGSAAPNAIAGAPVYPKPFTADNPMKLRINFAVGGQGAGAPDGTTPSTGIYDIDYVRVYSR